MLKRKLKKILIILLLMIMVVQMSPISYALPSWDQLPWAERDKIQNLLDSDTTTMDDINDLLEYYDNALTYEDLITYFSKCEPETYKQSKAYQLIDNQGSEGSTDNGNGNNNGNDNGKELSGNRSSGKGTSGSLQTSQGLTGFDDWQQQAQDFLEKGKNGQKITIQEAITSFVPIGRILVGIATIVLVIVGAIFGVRYMFAGANDKAQMKEKLIYYVISVVLVYGAVGIFTMVVNVVNIILS